MSFKDMFSDRAPRHDDHPTINTSIYTTNRQGGPAPPGPPSLDAEGQIAWVHSRRLAVYLLLEFLLITPLLFVIFGCGFLDMFFSEVSRTLALCLKLRVWEGIINIPCVLLRLAIPDGGWQWLAISFVYVAKGLMIMSRYSCTFGVNGRTRTLLFLSHFVGGFLVSVAFLSRAGGPGGRGFFNACGLSHHCTAVMLAGLVATLADACCFYRRGYLSERGWGTVPVPPPNSQGDGYSVLARGYDQGLFDLHYFVEPEQPQRQQQQQAGAGGGRRRRSSTGTAQQQQQAQGSHWLYNPPQITRYARMLFPPLPPPPRDLPSLVNPEAPEWVKALARVFGTRFAMFWKEIEANACLGWAVGTTLLVGVLIWPCEALLRMGGALVWGEDINQGGWQLFPEAVGSTEQALLTVVYTTGMVCVYVYLSLSVSTLLLYHLIRQPVDFSTFVALSQTGRVMESVTTLRYWLGKGWDVILQDPLEAAAAGGGSGGNGGGGASSSSSSTIATVHQHQHQNEQDEMWRSEMEDTHRVLHRTAILTNHTQFPPTLETYTHTRPASVRDKLYRAQAFLDLAIFAHTDAGRRKWVYADMSLWRSHARPLLAVVNALTLQLELQMEASGRVEGGVKSPLSNVHARLGLGEVGDAQRIATLIVEAEVGRRCEELVRARRKRGEPVSVSVGGRGGGGGQRREEGKNEKNNKSEFLMLPRRGAGVWGKETLTPLSLATVELQVVELSALGLCALYHHAVEVDRTAQAQTHTHTPSLEDSRGCSRHSIPAALASLVSCQLAIHLYSAMVKSGEGGEGGGLRFNVVRDRSSVVIPKLCGVSLAVDQAIEQIILQFYESDFASFGFAPLYARCVKMYVEALKERQGVGRERERGEREETNYQSPGPGSPVRRRRG